MVEVLENSNAEDFSLMRRLFECTGEAVYTWNTDSDEIIWYPEAANILGVAPGDLPTNSMEFLGHVSPDDAPQRAVQLSNNVNRGLAYQCEFKFRHESGRYHWVEERIVFARGEVGKPNRALGTIRVITELREKRSELERMALHDGLTGLPNRHRIVSALDDAAAAGADGGCRSVFLLVNIDRLSLLNAAYGFDAGDAVLVEVASRIEDSLRVGDMAGRVGGNQFGVVMFDTDNYDAEVFAHKLLSRFRGREIESDLGTIGVTVSIGAVALPDAAADSRIAVGRAEEALALAKSTGRDRYVPYVADQKKEETRERSLATGGMILRSLTDKRLDFAVQPVCDSRTLEPVFYECLMRIMDEQGKVLPAGDFIPQAEQLGIVRKLDRYMVERALEELSAHPEISLAVNVSAMSASDATMSSYIRSMVQAHRGVAERLIFEITETVALYEFSDTVSFISQMRDLGCRIAIDDFGAGFSSFRQLKELAIDLIKIDGQFVKGMAGSRQSQLFVDTLLGLANGLGIPVVAECVESEAEVAALKSRNVRYLQGNFIGQPSLKRPWEGSHPHSRLGNSAA